MGIKSFAFNKFLLDGFMQNFRNYTVCENGREEWRGKAVGDAGAVERSGSSGEARESGWRRRSAGGRGERKGGDVNGGFLYTARFKGQNFKS